MLHVDRFTVQQGLAQNWVVGVVHDSAGFAWLGTKRGLQRYDGRSFTAYSFLSPTAPSELAEEVSGILIGRDDALWVATRASIFRIAPDRRGVARYPLTETFVTWSLDSTGTLWYVDGGTLRTLRPGAAEEPGVVVAPRLELTDQPTLAAAGGKLWLIRHSDDQTVTSLDPATGEVRQFHLDGLRPLIVREDAIGRIWVGGIGGLAVLELETDVFRRLADGAGDTFAHLVPDRDGSLWALADRWVGRFDRTARLAERWTHEALNDRRVRSGLALDREGGLWISSLTHGVLRMDVWNRRFLQQTRRSDPALPTESDFIMALHETADGSVWVGTLGGGLTRMVADPQDPGAWRLIATYRQGADARFPASDDVWDLEDDAAGGVWAATNEGICRVAGQRFVCHRLPLREPTITAIERDAAGRFWLGVFAGGVVPFDPATGVFGSFVQLHSPVVSLHLGEDAGELWIGTMDQGVVHGRIQADTLSRRALTILTARPGAGAVFDFHRDGRGVLWAGSDRGLELWDAKSGTLRRTDIPELRGSTVFSIEEDQDGALWLGTAHGLVQYVPGSRTIRRFRREDGVGSGEFSRRSALRREDGSMMFGSAEGLTLFHPAGIGGSLHAVPVAITRWRKVSGAGVVVAAVEAAGRLELEPRDRAFTVEFSAVSFASSSQRQFRYRLDPLDADWIEAPDRQATYAAPPPGRYVFRVQSAGAPGGEWGEPGASVDLLVLPPFWQTAPFRALLVFLLATLFWAAHRMRVRAAVATERVRVRISRDLHDELGAGLSSIALLSDAVRSAPHVGELERRHVTWIGEAARTMVSNLRDIVWAIDPGGDRLDDIVSRMRDTASALLRGFGVTVRAPADASVTARIGMEQRRDLLLLYKEVLHNVARHSGAANVLIELALHGDTLELTITDDGGGFDPAAVQPGTGLRSVQERAARMGGRLDLHSEPGVGTRARLTLRVS